ncbi:MAG: spore photoproduct lyase [Chlamydiales bacterium]|jgi:spore photoproduct lyase
MFHSIYLEESVVDHPRSKALIARHPSAKIIPCEHYGEVFNKKSQNFRLQKKNPSLILAKKNNRFVLETPKAYGIGGERNFYFSHMLNCIFDCRYCFLQGMYHSAHYVHFVNELLPFFEKKPKGILELRTKSTQINFLLKREPVPNCVIAFSLTPKEIGESLEHKTAPLHRRLEAARKLQDKSWKIGFRFDPMIYCEDFRDIYSSFFTEVFAAVDSSTIHSVSLGAFRMPKGVYNNIARLYPKEKIFSQALHERNGMVSYSENREECSALGIRVCLVNPGMTQTIFFDNLAFYPGQEPDQHILPEDIAEAIAMVLEARQGTVFDEINLSPQKKVVNFSSKK